MLFRGRWRVPSLAGGARILALAALYVVVARLGLMMDAVSGFATLVWPPTGIALAALLLGGRRLWPGVALGAFAVNWWTGAPILVALGIGAGNTIEAVLGAWALERFGFRSLDRLRDAIALVGAGALASTAVSATVGVTSLRLGGIVTSGTFGKTWVAWWVGDMIGDLVVAPLILAWTANRRGSLEGRGVEAAALGVCLLGVALGVFAGSSSADPATFGQVYAFFPLLIWAAVRFGAIGATTATFLVCVVAVWSTAAGHGPFVRPVLHERLLLLQTFIAVTASTFLVLATLLGERRRAMEQLGETHGTLAVVNRELQQGEEQLRMIVEAAPSAIVMVGERGEIVLFNRQAEGLFGYSRVEVRGRPVELLVPQRFRTPHVSHRAMFFGDPQSRAMGAGRDLFGLRKDGTEVPVEIGLNPLRTREGRFVLASIIDITERKRAEEWTRNSLREKEVLVKEIYHRVKNNLQMIISLLRMQARALQDPAVKDALRESQDRIKSMALIHEKLHRSPDLANVNLAEYLRDLVQTLFQSYAVGSRRIDLRLDVADISLSLDELVPCGLIVNELVSNCLKHAFPDRRSGVIHVGVSALDGRCRVVVRDDGVGVKDLDAAHATTLGLSLVRTLAEQLSGAVRFRTDAGTTVEIEFPIQPPKRSDAPDEPR
jgi:two-component system, sensor histidine kinase PdtaS